MVRWFDIFKVQSQLVNSIPPRSFSTSTALSTSTTMSKPTFLFIPGAFHRPIIYDSIRARLSTHGYESTAVPLPSVGANPPTDDMSDDVYAIRSAAGTLLTQGKEVILVTHSYGGFPVGEALEGLGGRGRDQKNLQGGIIRLVYIAAGVLPESGQLGQRGDASLLPPFLKCDVEVMKALLAIRGIFLSLQLT
jgi:pimeloyl-ACP methyl ester carboxylesterase